MQVILPLLRTLQQTSFLQAAARCCGITVAWLHRILEKKTLQTYCIVCINAQPQADLGKKQFWPMRNLFQILENTTRARFAQVFPNKGKQPAFGGAWGTRDS